MEPIISPWIIYALSVADSAIPAFMFAAVFLTILCPVGIFFVREYSIDFYRGDSRSHKTNIKIYLIAGAICFFMSIITPSSKTIAAMIAASFLSPDNIRAISEPVKQEYLDLKKMISEYLVPKDRQGKVK